MSQYHKYISEKLAKRDYILAKELNLDLQKKFSVKPDNGRQIISRAVRDKVIRPSVITFGNGQLAYTRLDKKLSKEMVLAIAKVNRPPLYRLIVMLDIFEGMLPYHEAMKVSATPIKSENTKSDSIEKLVKEIETLEYGKLFRNVSGDKFIVYQPLLAEAEALSSKVMKGTSVDASFIPDVLKALQKYNIIDNSKVLYRNRNTPGKSISHNNYVWDAVAYTKTTGINDVRSSEANSFDKQTMVALDVVISRTYTDVDLQGFVSRIQGIQSAVKTGKRKVLPIVVYAETESKILVNRIKKLGFLCFDLGSIYGSRIYKILENVLLVKKADGAGNNRIDSADKVEEILSDMRNAGQEENLSNIKGDLFESLMFPLLNLVFSDAAIEPGPSLKSRNENGKQEGYEYDYIVTAPRIKEILVVELKGYASSNYISLGDENTKNTINWFFSRTFPFAKNILKNRDANSKITACYITTSKFKDDGVAFLSSINKGKLKPAALDVWYDGEKLMALLDQYKLVKAQQIIKRYYIKESDDLSDDLQF